MNTRIFLFKTNCLLFSLFLMCINAQAHSEESYFDQEWSVFSNKATDADSLKVLSAGAISALVGSTQDKKIRERWVDNQKISEEKCNFGDFLGTGAVSLIAAGLQYNLDDRDYVWQSQLRGFVTGSVAIYSLKTVANRKRPGSSRNYQSFPSGHTAIMFMTATQIQMAYDWPWGGIAYAVAGFTGATRIADDAHWFSDVIAGAFLGAWAGRASFYDLEKEMQSQNINRALKPAEYKPKSEITWVPMLQKEELAMYFSYRF